MSSYLVIARKWRPALFEEIIGQDHVTRTLKNALSTGRIAHAYLFSGPRGVGKTTAARILAKGLNCSAGPTASPCNDCESCRGITTGSSVDVFEIDGASNTGVENVRELRENIMYMPASGRYRVYIIDEVHMLSAPAFNAPLKTLEEPPPHAVFIFATTEVHKIPLTILSRCQRFDFRRIPFARIQAHLEKILAEEGIGYETDALFTIAREADGSLRDAQSLLDQALAFGAGTIKTREVTEALGLMDRTVLFELLSAVIAKDTLGCLNIVEKIHNFGYDLKRACGGLLGLLRDLTVIKATGSGSLLEASDHELEGLKRLAETTGTDRLHMLFNIIARGYEEVSRSTYPRYSLEMALLKAARFDEVLPVGELVERLEALGSRLAGGGQRAADVAVPSRREEPRTAKEPVPTAPQKAGEQTGDYRAGTKETSAEGLMEYLKGASKNLAKPLEGSTVKKEGNTVEIAAGDEAVNFLKIRKEKIEELASEYFKSPVKVEISSRGAKEVKKKPDRLVNEAVRIFGGKVIQDTYRRTNV